jgi:hypothetical protein
MGLLIGKLSPGSEEPLTERLFEPYYYKPGLNNNEKPRKNQEKFY